MIYTTRHIIELTGRTYGRTRDFMKAHGEQPYGYGTGWIIDADKAPRLLRLAGVA